MKIRSFPRNGFLLLGVLSAAAAAVFVIRASIVEVTGERVASAIAFGLMGVLWLTAYFPGTRSLAERRDMPVFRTAHLGRLRLGGGGP